MSNKERRKAPVLRFKGFTDDWEQRKLNTYLSVSKLKNKEERFSKQDVLSVSGDFGIVNQIKFQGRSFAGKSLSNYKIVKNGDIVYTKSPLKAAPYGIIKSNGGIPGIVSTLYAVYTPKKSVDSKFVELFFNDQLRLNRYLKPIVNIGAKHDMKVKNDEVINHFVTFPNKKEQLKISKLLQKMDDVISLQQRKLDRLLLLKKAYLTNLLPDKTQNPKVRFKEFNDKWKTLKLGNISSISAGGDVNKQKLLKKGRYPVIANALTNKGVIGYYESEYRIQAPAVTVTGRGDIGHAYARKTNFTPVVRLLSVKSKHNVDFLAEAINQKKVPFESTGVPQLTVPKLSNYKILFPSSITEENKIGNFIIKFDEIINLQNKKISSLEQVKNFLLQNMFI